MTRSPRPSIFQLGRVSEVDGAAVVSGWGIGLCADRCPCHRNPVDGKLQVHEDEDAGALGLQSFVDAGRCGCCRPWTTDELRAVLRDVAAVEAIECQEPATG